MFYHSLVWANWCPYRIILASFLKLRYEFYAFSCTIWVFVGHGRITCGSGNMVTFLECWPVHQICMLRVCWKHWQKWSLHSINPAVLFNRCCMFLTRVFFSYWCFVHVHNLIISVTCFLGFTSCHVCFDVMIGYEIFTPDFCEGTETEQRCFRISCSTWMFSPFYSGIGHWVNKLFEEANEPAYRAWQCIHLRWLQRMAAVLAWDSCIGRKKRPTLWSFGSYVELKLASSMSDEILRVEFVHSILPCAQHRCWCCSIRIISAIVRSGFERQTQWNRAVVATWI